MWPRVRRPRWLFAVVCYAIALCCWLAAGLITASVGLRIAAAIFTLAGLLLMISGAKRSDYFR
jgi:hypothetical protein